MKLFRTNKISFEALKLSIELYRLDKSNIRHYDNITRYMFFNDREKEIFYEPVYKKVRGV